MRARSAMLVRGLQALACDAHDARARVADACDQALDAATAFAANVRAQREALIAEIDAAEHAHRARIETALVEHDAVLKAEAEAKSEQHALQCRAAEAWSKVEYGLHAPPTDLAAVCVRVHWSDASRIAFAEAARIAHVYPVFLPALFCKDDVVCKVEPSSGLSSVFRISISMSPKFVRLYATRGLISWGDTQCFVSSRLIEMRN